MDVFTIRQEKGTVNSLNITIIGDLKYGRTVHSLVHILSLYNVHLNYISPENLKIPKSIFEEIESRGIVQNEYTTLLDSILMDTDVLYVTRIQKERFPNIEEYDNVANSYRITPETLTKTKVYFF